MSLVTKTQLINLATKTHKTEKERKSSRNVEGAIHLLEITHTSWYRETCICVRVVKLKKKHDKIPDLNQISRSESSSVTGDSRLKGFRFLGL